MKLKRRDTPDQLFKSALLIALISFIALSWNAPLSGDEYVHVQQAQKNIDYFRSFGENQEALNTPISRLKHYGQSFDTITTFLAEVLNIEDLYRFRHVANAGIAWLTVLFAALISVRITNDKYAGFITVILFLVSMRFIGHAMNNLKDIPFAFAFVFSFYFIIRFIEQLPKISLADLGFVAAGLAFGTSIRIGGLLIFAFYILFTGLYLYYLVVNGTLGTRGLPALSFRLIALSMVVLVIGYVAAILIWPWGLEDPLRNPMSSLQLIHNYPTTVRQIFEGKLYWSDNFPWYYLFKYLLITLPLIVWLGFLMLVFLIWKWTNREGIVVTIFLFIFFAFPLFYATVSGANVYGGWRQMLFTYPPLVSLSSIGIWLFIKRIDRDTTLTKFVVVVMSLFLVYPVYYLLRNYPYQYVYFNALAGGIEGAYGQYELDYYFTSFGKAYQFIDSEVKEDGLIVGANFIIPEYYKGKSYAPRLIDYYDRGSIDWDYAVICNTFLNPYQLREGFWPPKNVVYTEFVGDVPILVVLRRTDKIDLEGRRLLEQRRYDEAIIKLNEAIKKEPGNESILMNLARAYMRAGAYEDAKNVLARLEVVYPHNEWATDIRGELALRSGDVQKAIRLFQHNISYNYKFYHSYVNLALAYIEMGNTEEAISSIKTCLRINPFYQPGYQLYGKLLIEQGEIELGRRMLEFRIEEHSKYKRK